MCYSATYVDDELGDSGPNTCYSDISKLNLGLDGCQAQ